MTASSDEKYTKSEVELTLWISYIIMLLMSTYTFFAIVFTVKFIIKCFRNRKLGKLSKKVKPLTTGSGI